ncbi:MAG: OB-fold nucleic acid binding domain-containing protein [Eubacteriales bacterium]
MTAEIIDLVQVIGEMGEVVIHGQVTGWDEREIRGEKTIVTITVTDYTDTIRIKIFEKNDEMEAFREKVKKGSFIKLKGLTSMDRFDNELTISSVVGIKKSSDFRTPRTDNSDQTGGTPLPYEDERYGRCLRCEGYYQAGQVLGTYGHRRDRSRRGAGLSGCQPQSGKGR